MTGLRTEAQNAGHQGVPGAHGGRRRRRGGGGRGSERAMVPPAEFTSYYGRPVVKASPWEKDIPAYLFLGGLAGGSSLLAAGADLTGRESLRRPARIGAFAAVLASLYTLIHDLGRPSRFTHMLRVAKPTSPMSMGTWILTLYGPFAGAAAAAELADAADLERRLPRGLRSGARLLRRSARPAGVLAGVGGPALASYTAVLLADTATPSWHEAHRELPFVFVGSAASAAGGLGMLTASVHDAGPARRLALGGALVELGAEHRMERSMGITTEPLHTGPAGSFMRAGKALTVFGAAGSLLAGRSRVAAAVSGAALLGASVCTRFGIFEAGQASARDPKYTVVPQRERLNRTGPAGGEPVRT